MFKTFIIAIVAAFVFLTGCSSDEQGQTLESAQENDISDVDVEETFSDLLRQEFPAEFGGVGNEDLVNLGKEICGAFDRGVTFEESLFMAMDLGYSAEASGGVMGASIAAFCPEHEDKLG